MRYKDSTRAAIAGMAEILRPPPTRDASGWARAHRILPPGSPEPGAFRPERTPFMIPFAAATISPKYSTIIFACGSQMGKTENLLNLVGCKLTDGPYEPILLIFPTEKLSRSMSRDRFSKMIASTPVLAERLEQGTKANIMEKFFNGIRCGFGYAGSATELSSHPAALVVLDEIDRMDDVPGEGDPFLLAKARTKNYIGAKIGVTSTPTLEGASRIWSLWESGTMGRWSWPCPHCKKYFVPLLSLLVYDPEGTPSEAKESAYIACPECGGKVETKHREKMNARGRYEYCIKVDTNKYKNRGPVPPKNPTASFWASGLASPWQSFGDIAYVILTAIKSGDAGTIQSAVNTYAGETYKIKGDAPAWEQVKTQVVDYSPYSLPSDLQLVTMGVDVQQDLLYYVIRGYGHRGESWLIKFGEVPGKTEFDQVWIDLSTIVEQLYDGMPVQRCFIDSGYVPGKDKYVRPDNQIYKFCRIMQGLCYPSKGKDTQPRPIIASKIDVTVSGITIKKGLTLWHIDTDYFKRQLYSSIRRDPLDPYGWHVHPQITDDYCKQIVSEECITEESGKRVWIKTREDNHYLDCEVLADAAAHSAGVHNLADVTPKPKVATQQQKQEPADSFIVKPQGSFFRRR